MNILWFFSFHRTRRTRYADTKQKQQQKKNFCLEYNANKICMRCCSSITHGIIYSTEKSPTSCSIHSLFNCRLLKDMPKCKEESDEIKSQQFVYNKEKMSKCKVVRCDTHTHHQLFHGVVLFVFSRCVVVFVDDLHPDVIFGRHNSFQIC